MLNVSEVYEVFCDKGEISSVNNYWLYSRTSLKTEYESSMAVVNCYSFVVGLKSE